jgi:UDP-glucose 4-epimerase
MKYIDTKSGFECFNLGTGEGYSVKNIISKVEEITNKKINIEISSRRIGDPDTLISSGKKSKEILKWMPKHSSIKEIIETANSWYLSRK